MPSRKKSDDKADLVAPDKAFRALSACVTADKKRVMQ